MLCILLFFGLALHLCESNPLDIPSIKYNISVSPVNATDNNSTCCLKDALTFTQKCYHNYGCFKSLYFLGFHFWPSSEIDVVFKLFNRNKTISPEDLNHFDSSKITASGFDRRKDTKVIVHGFHGLCAESWIKTLIKELLMKGDFNVICVDWRKGADHVNYLKAAANTQMVGKIISLFIELLEQHFGSIRERCHFIGFSLGAHAAGFAGSKIPGVKRISGLDPAGPAFAGNEPDMRLDPSDALFVDVIHTNGQPLYLGGAGTLQTLGHLDLYANGGKKQPGCHNAVLSYLYNIFLFFNKARKFRGNHERAIDIFIQSINSQCRIRAERCSSWADYESGRCHQRDKLGTFVGYDSDERPALDGTYFFATKSDNPLCGPQYFVCISIQSEATIKYRGSLTLFFESKSSESQVIRDGVFIAPSSLTQMLTLESLSEGFDTLYIEYQRGGWFNWSNKDLHVTSVELSDLRSGQVSVWTPEPLNITLSSGIKYRLIKNQGD